MSASKCGQRDAKRGEIGLQTDLQSLESPPCEIECINSRCGEEGVQTFLRACSHCFSKCEWVENSANLGARRRPDRVSGLGVQRRVALFSTHSLRVAAKKVMRGVAKPCRGVSPAAFRALRMAFLIRNASWKSSVNRP